MRVRVNLTPEGLGGGGKAERWMGRETAEMSQRGLLGC